MCLDGPWLERSDGDDGAAEVLQRQERFLDEAEGLGGGGEVVGTSMFRGAREARDLGLDDRVALGPS